MPIELIKTTNKAPPVAMRFGNEIVTKDNLAECSHYSGDARPKALILAAIECGLLDELTFLADNPRYTRETLKTWATIDAVMGFLQTIRHDRFLQDSLG